MAARTVYHVKPSDDGWVVEKEGAKRASSKHGKKDEAVKQARSYAEKQQPSQIIIHKKDGSIQEERTYGDDPHPPRG